MQISPRTLQPHDASSDATRPHCPIAQERNESQNTGDWLIRIGNTLPRHAPPDLFHATSNEIHGELPAPVVRRSPEVSRTGALGQDQPRASSPRVDISQQPTCDLEERFEASDVSEETEDQVVEHPHTKRILGGKRSIREQRSDAMSQSRRRQIRHGAVKTRGKLPPLPRERPQRSNPTIGHAPLEALQQTRL
eukprot:9492632-Pyramimonas_sp.AAC.1